MKLLDRTTSTDLTDVETTLRQAESLFLRHEDNASAKLLARLERQRLTPEQRWSVLLLKGWLCHGRADHVQAMKYANRVLSESQDAYYRGRAHHLRGLSHCGFAYAAPDASEPEVLAATREYELALEMLTDFPERIRVYSSMAILLADTGQADQAIAMLETVLQQSHPPSPDLDWLHASLGELYAQDKGDCVNGVKQLELAVSMLDPVSITHSWVHSLLAQCYNGVGEFEKAHIHAKRALDLAGKDKAIQKFALVRAHEQYAIALTWGDIDMRLAEHHLRIAIELVGEEGSWGAKLHARLGEALLGQDRPAEALRTFETALRVDKQAVASRSFFTLVGKTAFESKEYAKAVEFLELAIVEPDEDEDLLIHIRLYLGAALYHLERYREAADVFRAGLRQAPANHADWSSLMKWLLTTNRMIEQMA